MAIEPTFSDAVSNGQVKKLRGTRAYQRQRSRTALIQAARLYCTRGAFVRCSIADIVQEAGLSRTAFYMHFQSKEELLEAVLDDQADWFFRQNDAVTEEQLSTRDGIVHWLQGVIQGYREAGDLMQYFWICNHVRDAFLKHQAYRDRAVEALGHRLPSLGVYGPDGAIDVQVYHRVMLFMYQMEQCCVHLAFDAAGGNADIMIATLAENLEQLMHRD